MVFVVYSVKYPFSFPTQANTNQKRSISNKWAPTYIHRGILYCQSLTHLFLWVPFPKQHFITKFGSSLLFFNPHPHLWLTDFKERRREGEREGEKHQCERETPIGCLSFALQPGTEPVTQACALTGNRTPDPLVHGTRSHWSGLEAALTTGYQIKNGVWPGDGGLATVQSSTKNLISWISLICIPGDFRRSNQTSESYLRSIWKCQNPEKRQLLSFRK